MTFEFLTDFGKIIIFQIHENPSSGNWVVPYGWTDMMKLTVAFCNFVHVSKREYNYHDLFSETKYGLHDSL
jgi:hypothetical protein